MEIGRQYFMMSFLVHTRIDWRFHHGYRMPDARCCWILDTGYLRMQIPVRLWMPLESNGDRETFFQSTVFIMFMLDNEILLVLASSVIRRHWNDWFIHSCPNPNSSLLATYYGCVCKWKQRQTQTQKSKSWGRSWQCWWWCWCIIMLYGRSVLYGRWSMVHVRYD